MTGQSCALSGMTFLLHKFITFFIMNLKDKKAKKYKVTVRKAWIEWNPTCDDSTWFVVQNIYRYDTNNTHTSFWYICNHSYWILTFSGIITYNYSQYILKTACYLITVTLRDFLLGTVAVLTLWLAEEW